MGESQTRIRLSAGKIFDSNHTQCCSTLMQPSLVLCSWSARQFWRRREVPHNHVAGHNANCMMPGRHCLAVMIWPVHITLHVFATSPAFQRMTCLRQG